MTGWNPLKIHTFEDSMPRKTSRLQFRCVLVKKISIRVCKSSKLRISRSGGGDLKILKIEDFSGPKSFESLFDYWNSKNSAV